MGSSPESGARAEDAAEESGHYVGLTTRALAFLLDAALINLVAIITALGVGLILSLVHIPGSVTSFLEALAGAAYWADARCSGDAVPRRHR
jgi:uncharacterized RDD family membrane protein YckC